MKKILFFVTMLLALVTVQSQNLNYGDVIHLQNGWNNYGGGYLDTRGYQKDYEKTGNHLCISTATTSNRDGGSGTWKVISATGKANGTPVLVGDAIHLQNGWNNYGGGYLDTRGYQKDYETTGNHLCVSTANSQNRDSGSGVWKVISATGKANGTPVTQNLEINLQNGWNNYGGGYLDTRGYQKDYEKTGNHLCVSTATTQKRDGGSGTWKVQIVTKNTLNTGQILKVGEDLVSANGAYILRMQTDGNLCVYKYSNGTQGAFVWGSYQTNVKYSLGANYRLVMQNDANLCIYNASNTFQWGSYQQSGQKYSLVAGCKLVLTNEGKLNIINSAGQIIWTN